MKAKNKKYVIAAIAVILLLSLVLGALILFPAPDQLTYLQNMINEQGYCKVSTGRSDFYIQADIATIENDELILKRSAATGNDSYVVISSGNNSAQDSILTKSASIRFITTPKKMLEISLTDAKMSQNISLGTMSMKMECRSKWELWLSNIHEKIKNIMKK